MFEQPPREMIEQMAAELGIENTKDLQKEAKKMWDTLNQLHQADPASYQTFVQKQMKDAVAPNANGGNSSGGGSGCQQQKSIVPEKGFVVKTFVWEEEKNGNCSPQQQRRKIFINFCTHMAIQCPTDDSGKKIQMNEIEKEAHQRTKNIHVPLVVSPLRTFKDKKGEYSYAIDVIVHPCCLVARNCSRADLVTLGMKAIEEDHFHVTCHREKKKSNSDIGGEKMLMTSRTSMTTSQGGGGDDDEEGIPALQFDTSSYSQWKIINSQYKGGTGVKGIDVRPFPIESGRIRIQGDENKMKESPIMPNVMKDPSTLLTSLKSSLTDDNSGTCSRNDASLDASTTRTGSRTHTATNSVDFALKTSFGDNDDRRKHKQALIQEIASTGTSTANDSGGMKEKEERCETTTDNLSKGLQMTNDAVNPPAPGVSSTRVATGATSSSRPCSHHEHDMKELSTIRKNTTPLSLSSSQHKVKTEPLALQMKGFLNRKNNNNKKKKNKDNKSSSFRLYDEPSTGDGLGGQGGTYSKFMSRCNVVHIPTREIDNDGPYLKEEEEEGCEPNSRIGMNNSEFDDVLKSADLSLSEVLDDLRQSNICIEAEEELRDELARFSSTDKGIRVPVETQRKNH